MVRLNKMKLRTNLWKLYRTQIAGTEGDGKMYIPNKPTYEEIVDAIFTQGKVEEGDRTKQKLEETFNTLVEKMDYNEAGGGPNWLKTLTRELDANNYELTGTIVEETLDEEGPSGGASGGASGAASGGASVEQTGKERQKLQEETKAMMGVKDLEALETQARLEEALETQARLREAEEDLYKDAADEADEADEPPVEPPVPPVPPEEEGVGGGAGGGAAPPEEEREPAPPAPPAPPPPQEEQQTKAREPKVLPTVSNPIASTIDQIPDIRLSTDNKTAEQLRNDIRYFFKNFPKPLANISNQLKNLNKMKLVQLQRLHRKIVGILQPNKQEKGMRTGIVIDAEEYIAKKVREVYMNEYINNLQMPNIEPLVVEGDNNANSDVKDIGSYEVKRGPDGLLNSQREPIYRYIPTTQEDTEETLKYDYESTRKPNRISLPKPKMRNLVQTGKREVRNNPFLEKVKGHRLKVML